MRRLRGAVMILTGGLRAETTWCGHEAMKVSARAMSTALEDAARRGREPSACSVLHKGSCAGANGCTQGEALLKAMESPTPASRGASGVTDGAHRLEAMPPHGRVRSPPHQHTPPSARCRPAAASCGQRPCLGRRSRR